MRRAVFLDRDGVLNQAEVRDGLPHPPATADDVVVLPGVADACHRLAAAGWLLVVVTNQPDIARGTTTPQEVEAINAAVVAGLGIDEVVVCPHDDLDRCRCRKPLPGMLVDAARRGDIDLGRSAMVGDRWRDIDAGAAAGVETYFVDHGYREELRHRPDHVVASLAAAADLLLADEPSGGTDEPSGGADDPSGGADDPSGGADDWETHWSEYTDLAKDNPAQVYRIDLILDRVAQGALPRRVLDIGSGPGDLLVALSERWPAAELVGVELSHEGVRHASAQLPGARFHQHDLLGSTPPPDELVGWADVAVCSEVLEHVDEPARFLRVATELLAPGGRLVITVPGGPRTAFDRHIGHRRHYRRSTLQELLGQTDLVVDHVSGVGFPFFDAYKLAVLLQGDRLATDVSTTAEPSRLARAAMRAFGLVLRPRRNSQRFGWQMVATARRRDP